MKPRAKTHKARPHPTSQKRPAAIATSRRLGGLLALDERASSRSSLSDGELFAAGALLLLFVVAAASVLRLSSRMSGPAGRFG